MTVTPLPSRPVHARARRLPVRARRPLAVPGREEPALTVHLTVTLDGDDRYAEAIEVLDALRQITERYSSATVSLAGSPTPPRLPAADPAVTADNANAGAVQVLVGTRSVRAAGVTIAFTRVEFDLLLFLAEHPRQVFTRQQLLQSVWGYSHAGLRTVDVHIRRLRAKLGEDLVTTVRGVGYRLADGADLRVARS